MRRASRAVAPLLCAAVLAGGCARPSSTGFSTERARTHVQVLAGTIGSRPAGSEANDRARQYVVDQLRLFGFDVRVQVADARRPEFGHSARVQNIIALRRGVQPEAIALVSHYDSSSAAPGGADDGLGVAVSLEAARVLSAMPLRHTLAVLVTDAEELGLMGAAALNTDPVARQLGAYVNIESVGSAGPSLLFETGPGNSWIVDVWAAHAPRPYGGSFALEVYRRIPNDTDFTMLRRLAVPGLNFASILDGYAYHTARDTADRLAPFTIDQTGHNVVRVVQALDGTDLTRRTPDQAVYSDLLGRTAFSMGPMAAAWIAGLAVLLGALAWFKSLRAAVVVVGGGRFLLTAFWSAIGTAAVLASMIAAAWLLREAREVYHPWYARPERLFVFTAAIGVLAGWTIARAGAFLPYAMRGTRHPVLAWAIALPVWILLAAAASYYLPAAAYLFNVPLLVAGVLLLVTPLARTAAVRLSSFLVLCVTLAMWGWLLLQLLRFAVAHFGRQPIITPVWVYAALIFMGGMMWMPPALAAVTGRPLRTPALATALLLVAVVAAGGYAYAAPAYTYDQPLRRAIQFVHDAATARAFWQVGSTEPGLDLERTSMQWAPLGGPLPSSAPTARLRHSFVFFAEVPPPGEIPGRVTMRRSRLGDSVQFTISVIPAVRALGASFVMPAGLAPVRPNLPGIARGGRWVASFGAVPMEGIAFRGFVHASDEPRLDSVQVILHTSRFPGGGGWQGLPPWLPQERVVWSGEARYIVRPLPEVAPPQ